MYDENEDKGQDAKLIQDKGKWEDVVHKCAELRKEMQRRNLKYTSREQERMSKYDFSSVGDEELRQMRREQLKLMVEATSFDGTVDEVETSTKYHAIDAEAEKRNIKF